MDCESIRAKEICTDEIIRILQLYEEFHHKIDLYAGFVRWVEYSSTLTSILNRWANSNSPVAPDQLTKLLYLKTAMASAYLTGQDIEQRRLLRNYDPENKYKQNFTKLLLLSSINNLNQELFSGFLSAPDDVAFYLAIGWLSERAQMTKNAAIYHQKIVDNFNRFHNLDIELEFIPNISKAYMYTTYSSSVGKDKIKNVMHQLIATAIKSKSDNSAIGFAPSALRKNPRILVIHENLSDTHVMMRCYLGVFCRLDETFDMFHLTWNEDGHESIQAKLRNISITEENLTSIVAEIRNIKPDIILYPSIGMSTLAISLSSLRLAPIQLQLFGHPSSSNSPVIDGSKYNSFNFQNTGNEKFTTNQAFLKGIHLPFALKPIDSNLACQPRSVNSGPLSVGFNSIVMKLGPEFMEFLSQISWPENCKFNFFPAELGGRQLLSSNLIKRFFPTAQVHPVVEYEVFMQQLASQDVTICTFPFGNSNGMLDCLRLGLPTFVLKGKDVCSGPEYELLSACGLQDFIFPDKIELKKALETFLFDTDWRLQKQTQFRKIARDYISTNNIQQALDYELETMSSWFQSSIQDFKSNRACSELEYQD